MSSDKKTFSQHTKAWSTMQGKIADDGRSEERPLRKKVTSSVFERCFFLLARLQGRRESKITKELQVICLGVRVTSSPNRDKVNTSVVLFPVATWRLHNGFFDFLVRFQLIFVRERENEHYQMHRHHKMILVGTSVLVLVLFIILSRWHKLANKRGIVKTLN